MGRGAVGLAVVALFASCAFDGSGFGVAEDEGGDGGPAGTDGATGDASAGDGGGSLPDGGGADAGDPEELGPWGTPTVIPALSNVAEDDDPTVTGDLRELYFDSDRDGGHDIWVSTRESASAPWGEPEKVEALSVSASDGEPQISADGRTIWFASLRGGANTSGAWDIFVSTRSDRESPWSKPEPVPELNSDDTDFHLSPDAAHTYALLSSNRPNGFDYDTYEVSRSSAEGAWNMPTLVPALNSGVHDANVTLTPDALHAYFDSTRSGSDGRDLWVASRTDTGQSFEPPSRIEELASGDRDSDPWVSADLRYMVFASDRSGDMEIYQTSR